LWIGGAPTTGKTFTGDYLETRGWHHIDGDQGIHTKDETIRNKFMVMAGAFEGALKGEKVPEEKWKPYFQHLVDQVREAQKTHNKIVVTFAILELFGGERDFIATELVGCTFVKLTANTDTLVERWLERNTRIVKEMGSTMEESWKNPMNKAAREIYGEEYSDEAYRKQARDMVFAADMVRIPDDAMKNCFHFANDDHAGNAAIKQINKLVGLEDIEIDKAAVEAVNMKRMQQVDMKELGKAFEDAEAKEKEKK